MEENMITAPVNEMELMQKMNRVMRRARMGSPAGPGMPGRGPAPAGQPGMDLPPMPPANGPMMSRPPMGPGCPDGMNRSPMPPMDGPMMGQPPMGHGCPDGMNRPPMPPMDGPMMGQPLMGPGGMDRPPMPPFGPRGMKRPPLSREQLLVMIDGCPDGIRQKALAEKLGINQSSTSELVDKLETGGYLARKVDPEDRRATLLFLTELGKARAAEVRDEQKNMFGGMFAKLTEEEKQTLSALLDKLLAEPQE